MHKVWGHQEDPVRPIASNNSSRRDFTEIFTVAKVHEIYYDRLWLHRKFATKG